MYDLHTHSLLSDGELLPSEVATRYEAKGYKAIAITDHVDASNIKTVAPSIVEFCKKWPKHRIKVIPGIELTHIPLEHFGYLTKYARKNGIKIIVAHGETVSEPVLKGTNIKALNSDIDILAHPGLITEEEIRIAKKRGIFLEITARKSHRISNKHVVRLATKFNAKLIINSDSHLPSDILTPHKLTSFALEAGITKSHLKIIQMDTQRLIGNLTRF